MSSRSPALLIAPILLAGCLQEGPEPSGKHLFDGQTLASPGFIKVGDETLIRFEDRRIPARKNHGAVSDLWTTSFDGTRQRQVLANWSDAWPEEVYSASERYFMVDERLVETEGGMARVADLVRLGPTLDEEFRLPGVWIKARFTVPIKTLYPDAQPGRACPGFPRLTDHCPQFLFERPMAPGHRLPTLLLWNGEEELPLGPDSGSFQIQPVGSGSVYFIAGEAHTLTRFVRPINLTESLRNNVTRFQISGDERYAAVTLSDGGASKTVVLDLLNKTEIALAHPNPTGGLGGFGQDRLYYTQIASSAGPAELHVLNLVSGEDTFETLPPPLANLAGVLSRDCCDERLLLDGAGHGVFTGKDDLIGRRVVNGPLYTPAFTDDGAFLMYIQRAASTEYDTTVQGALMFQDAELAKPPVMVSPAGLLVTAQNGRAYFFTDGDEGPILVFWAHLGRGSSDLYFADYRNGSLPTNLRLKARAIRSVSISAHSLFGIVNMSQQDAVGDLVVRNLDTGVDRLYAQAVSEAAEYRDEVTQIAYSAYIVRGRADSDRSGLWLTTLAPPVMPDGGSD